VKYWLTAQEYPFAGIFTHLEEVYINIQGKGIQQIQQEDFVPQAEGKLFADTYINTTLPFSPQETLLGTNDNKFYLFDGQFFTPYKIASEKYIQESTLTGGITLNEEEFVLATISGGCVIINKNTGQTRHVINYQTGLADDEVLALGKDAQNGLWICNEQGIMRSDTDLPVVNFGDYPGIEGNITSVTLHDSTLYVGTTEGLFYLTKVDKVEQVIKLVKQQQQQTQVLERNIHTMIKVSPKVENNNPALPEQNPAINPTQIQPETKDKKQQRQDRREQRRQKRKGNKDNVPEEIPAITNKPTYTLNPTDTIKKVTEKLIKTLPPKIETITEYVKDDKNYALQSFPFFYNKVKGLQIKCKQLLPFRDKILVATTKGLYEVLNHTQSQVVIPDREINFIWQSPTDSTHIYVGAKNTLAHLIWEEKEKDWKVHGLISNLQEEIFSIAEWQNELWLGAERTVYRVKLDAKRDMETPVAYDLPDDYAERVIARVIDDKPVFILSSGIFRYSPKQEALVRDAHLEKYFNTRSQVFYQQSGWTWVKPIQENWLNLETTPKAPSNQSIYLSFFEEIQNIYVDAARNIWVVADNKLFRVNARSHTNPEQRFKILLHTIRFKQDSIPLQNIQLSYQQNDLKFELSTPFYVREKGMQYQYKLEGLAGSEWSEWSLQNEVHFQYIPSGAYSLKVRAKNIFGQVSEEKLIPFRVNPPIWGQWWFILLILSAVVGGTYGLFRLRTHALQRANEYLEGKIQEKTSEIAIQKEQLEVAFHEISDQKALIEEANEELIDLNQTLEVKVEERTLKLKNTLQELLQTQQELDTFLYRASHDLRGPISRLVGLAKLAKMEKDTQAIHQNLNLLELTAQKMGGMLDKLTNVYVITREEVDYDDFNMYDMLENLKKQFKKNPAFESVYLMNKIEGLVNIHTDRTLFQIILENLLENAFQYHSPNPDVFPIVDLHLKADNEFIQLKITDNGIGIEPEHQAKMFEMFYRGTERSKGSGLGLYLVKKAAEKLNGELHFKSNIAESGSKAGNVTSFSVVLPHTVTKLSEKEALLKAKLS
jgi:signal transduction histidine kinase